MNLFSPPPNPPSQSLHNYPHLDSNFTLLGLIITPTEGSNAHSISSCTILLDSLNLILYLFQFVNFTEHFRGDSGHS